MRYLKDHWYGRQSFIWSFWINLVAVRAVLSLVQPYFQHPHLAHSTLTTIATIGFALLANGVIFGWQVVGLWRSSQHYLKQYGSMALVWGAQLAVVFFVWHALSSLLNGWQSTTPEEELFTTRMDREHASKYKLSYAPAKKAIMFDGSIELGSTKQMVKFFDQHPDAAAMILNSNGGNIYEARGIAQLVMQKGLATIVVDTCSSACITVFIAGRHRSISSGAKLGFHQYRLDVDYQVPNVNQKEEQRRDRLFFEHQSISPEFLDKIFNAPSDQIWYPPHDLLLQSGVVHASNIER